MKKTLLVLIALLVVVALVVGGCAPTTESDATASSSSGAQTVEKSFTVIVVHKDGTEKTFNYTTSSNEKLGAILVSEGLIVESDSPGLYNIVDGETADWNVDQSYWAFYINGEMAMQGMNDTAISSGDTFKLVYTK